MAPTQPETDNISPRARVACRWSEPTLGTLPNVNACRTSPTSVTWALIFSPTITKLLLGCLWLGHAPPWHLLEPLTASAPGSGPAVPFSAHSSCTSTCPFTRWFRLRLRHSSAADLGVKGLGVRRSCEEFSEKPTTQTLGKTSRNKPSSHWPTSQKKQRNQSQRPVAIWTTLSPVRSGTGKQTCPLLLLF